jgi:hypothetical protein
MRASTPGVDRLARCESLLAWLEREGCEHAVRVGESSGASVGVFASRDVKRGEALIRCPVACAMTARDTRPSPDDDDATAAFKAALDAARPRLDDAQRLRLFLLRERRLSENPPERPGPPPGRWASYARSLPGDELLDILPLGWSREDLARRLRGTPALDRAMEERAELERLERAARDAEGFSPLIDLGTTASSEGAAAATVSWAHAAYWSRAIALPLSAFHASSHSKSGVSRAGSNRGGQPSLVPLLDLCNHSAGARTTLRARGSRFELVADADVRRGAEVRIDYGAMGNAELLARHGFVIPNNPADTTRVTLREGDLDDDREGGARGDGFEGGFEGALRPGGGSTEGGAFSFSCVLHRGVAAWGEVPDGLLEAARRFRGAGGDEEGDAGAVARWARREARKTDAGEGGGGGGGGETGGAALDDDARVLRDAGVGSDAAAGFEATPGPRAEAAGRIVRAARRALLLDLAEVLERTGGKERGGEEAARA